MAMIRDLVWSGFPEESRAQIWEELANVQLRAEQAHVTYAQLLKGAATDISTEDESSASVYKQIELDILRSGSPSPEIHGALRRILHAFAKFNPTVGYTQGMNFVVVVLLHYLKEEQAFWVLTFIVMDRLNGIFANLQAVVVEEKVFSALAALHLPEISAKLEKNSMIFGIWLHQWLLTVFSYSFPIEVVGRIWDVFLSEGVTAIHAIGLAILKINEDAVLSLSPDTLETVVDSVREWMSTLADPHELIKTAEGFAITEDQIGAIRNFELKALRAAPLMDAVYGGVVKLAVLKAQLAPENNVWSPLNMDKFAKILTDIAPRLAVNLPDVSIQDLFTIMSLDGRGAVRWGDMMCGLTVMCHASAQAKVRFCFDTWDPSNSGVIDSKSVSRIINVLERMVGKFARKSDFDVETDTPSSLDVEADSIPAKLALFAAKLMRKGNNSTTVTFAEMCAAVRQYGKLVAVLDSTASKVIENPGTGKGGALNCGCRGKGDGTTTQPEECTLL